MILTVAVAMFFQQVGNPIVSPPVQTQAPANVSVNITPPPPDPAATAAMYSFSVATLERDHAEAPVNWATGLLSGTNIWTTTPVSHFADGNVRNVRNAARLAALGLFLLAIVWTGAQLAFGAGMGTTSYQLLLPPLFAGFLIAIYSETIIVRSIDLNNWLCNQMGSPSLVSFSGDALRLPERPAAAASPGALEIAASFFEGLIGSVIYAVVLIVLELKMIFREGVLIVGSVAMPLAGVLWAVKMTHGWGVRLFTLFFGWLFSQPLVVACLTLGGTLLTLLNLTDGAGEFLVKVAILFAAIKMVSFFAGGSLGGGAMFGLAGVLFLMRRMQSGMRRAGSQGSSPQAPQPAAAVQPGIANGTGAGTGATGRPWRPAMGAA